jgi:hypothetical protein
MHDGRELAPLYGAHANFIYGIQDVREGRVKGDLAQERTGSVGIAGKDFRQAG